MLGEVVLDLTHFLYFRWNPEYKINQPLPILRYLYGYQIPLSLPFAIGRHR